MKSRKILFGAIISAGALTTGLVLFSQNLNVIRKTIGEDQTYTLAFDAANAPETYGESKQIVVNESRHTIGYVNYSGASQLSEYHASFADGGYIENYEEVKGSKGVTLTGLGNFVLTYGQLADDLYLTKSFTLEEGVSQDFRFEVPSNYFKLQADGAASLKELSIEYTCVSAPAKYMVSVNHLALDGTVLDDAEHFFYNQSDVNSLYTLTPKAIEGKVKDKDTIKGIVLGHKSYDVYHSELDSWDGTTESSSWSGSGTQADPYLIQSGADLLHLKNEIGKMTVPESGNNEAYVGKYFKQTKSIDLSSYSGNFIIGQTKVTSPVLYFAGNYNGNNCSIRGLKITSGGQCSALFSKINGTGAGLSNLSVYGSVAGGNFSAGFIGRCCAPISNLTNYCTVTESGANGAGGIAAECNKNVTNCVNYGNISITSSHAKIGGIVGTCIANNNTYANCENYGTISNTLNKYVAGIVGHLYATNSTSKMSYFFNNCLNAGEIIANSRSGGIVGGYDTGATLFNANGCGNYGNITLVQKTSGDYGSGGIAGKVAVGVVQNCVNFGNVISQLTADSVDVNIGGIIGYANNDFKDVTGAGYKPGDGKGIFDCENYGKICGSQRVGGIVASCAVDIKRCTNYGQVTVDYNQNSKVSYAGGISSGTMITGVTFEDCVNRGEVFMKTKAVSQFVGGIIGHSGGGFNFTAKNCENYGYVYGNYCVGGIMGTTGSAGTTASQLAVKLLITGCTNYGDINGANPAGGIIGFLNNSQGGNCLVDCANHGEVSVRDAGGLAGDLWGKLVTEVPA